jgi:hypothetical protein
VVESEGVAREQVPDIVADSEPHFTLNHTRLQRERVGVPLKNRPRGPTSLDNLVESLRPRVCLERLEGDLIHCNPLQNQGDLPWQANEARSRLVAH